MQIAAALGTTVAALIGESPARETPVPLIIRRGERRHWSNLLPGRAVRPFRPPMPRSE